MDALRLMRKGCTQRASTLKHAMQQMPPLKMRGQHRDDNNAEFPAAFHDVRERLRERTSASARTGLDLVLAGL